MFINPNAFKGVFSASIVAVAFNYSRSPTVLRRAMSLSFIPSRENIAIATVDNATYKPSARPVALFLGGTSGIGRAMAEQLAQQTNGRAHIILLGRNEEAAKKIIASFPHTDASVPEHEASNYSFIKVDATSMAQVREVTKNLREELGKINYIVATAGFTTTKGRDETSEGIDRKMACNFYARFRFIHDLAPLVEKAADRGELVGVTSILAAGRGGRVELDNLGLMKGYGRRTAQEHAVTYTDAAMETFATMYPKVRFAQVFPGGVTTPMTTSFTGSRFVVPLFRFTLMTPAECAQMMWWRLWTSDAHWSTGAHQINHRGEEIPHNPHVTDELRESLWQHAVKMTGLS
ncbi:hypothetical protein FRC19_004633 [Serendipita sp. 401]|nr:hypothetical protein FRC19_004633 [Serendipita sp. 401]KAG9034210.1 hypothetical protein FS842_003837 [Serendipita sp. 407]